MRYAIVSDIHANLQAWNVIWADTVANGVDQVICLGDIVGYGPRPAETLSSVYTRVNQFIVGNHDAVVGGLRTTEGFNADAQRMIAWTAEQLDKKAVKLFGQLPYTLNIDAPDFPALCVHGSAWEPELFHYVMNEESARKCFEESDLPLIFVGHTHAPKIHVLDKDNGYACHGPGNFKLKPGNRYIINAGSVGMPRDRDFRACYCIYDTSAMSIVFNRAAYDLDAFKSDVRERIGKSKQAESVLVFFERNQSAPLREALDFTPTTQQTPLPRKRTSTGKSPERKDRETRQLHKRDTRRGKRPSRRSHAVDKKSSRSAKSAKPPLSIMIMVGGGAVVTLIAVALYFIGNNSTPANNYRRTLQVKQNQLAKAPATKSAPNHAPSAVHESKPDPETDTGNTDKPVNKSEPQSTPAPEPAPEPEPETAPAPKPKPAPKPEQPKVAETAAVKPPKKPETAPKPKPKTGVTTRRKVVVAEADAYISGGMGSFMNFGTEKKLLVKTELNAEGKIMDNIHLSYLRFNLSQVKGDVVKMILRLRILKCSKSCPENGLQLIGDNTWNESELTAINVPKPTQSLAKWQPRGNTNITINLTPLAKQILTGDGKLSLRILALPVKGKAGLTVYASREDPNEANRPKLIVELKK